MDEPRINHNIRCSKIDNSIFFDAQDVILALYKVKDRGSSMDTIIHWFETFQKEAQKSNL